MTNNYRWVKLGCYATNVSMSVVASLSPLLFLTFRSLYGISYSLLGLLVLINFSTQLIVDLIFSFLSHKFDIPKTVKLTPFLTFLGIFIYAVWPYIFPSHVYLGLVIGTVVFSASGGLAEVLISPTIAAIPSENPEREMSKLHSIYAWGVVFVVIISTLFILIFGAENWQILAFVFLIVPLFAVIFFSKSEIPTIPSPERISGTLTALKNPTLWLCAFAIFLGGASECTMAQWSSGYLEGALGIPKIWGDIFGTALFAVMLGLGRSLYSKYGKQVEKILFFGAIGAAVCYIVAVVSPVKAVGLAACALTGLCVSMLWPGCLIIASERIPTGGVFIYAIMASGGDLGASVAPQLVGVITDVFERSAFANNLSERLGILTEQLAMKAGMLVGTIFPIFAIVIFGYIFKTKKRA